MLKLYRKLFLCQHEGGSVLSIRSASSHGTRDLIDFVTREDSDNEVSNRIDQISVRVPADSTASQIIHESYQSIETESSEEPRHEVITTQALIHAGELSQNRKRTVLKPELMAVRSPILECKSTEQIIQDWDEQSTQGIYDYNKHVFPFITYQKTLIIVFFLQTPHSIPPVLFR